ncbi:MAG TPA: glycosyltransferase family 4 protein [Bryobacteraceae bacterium]|nr:glycosyltransferase family 4 protein [Bryobacteraceae bacterium]
MRVLALDQFSELGGGQQCLLDLLPAIRARGWQALVGVPGDGPMVARIRECEFETVKLECGPYACGRKTLSDAARFLAQTPRLARQIRELAERFAPDVIYVNGPRLLPAAAGAGGALVYHAHRILPGRGVRAVCGWALRRSRARVIGVCRYVADSWVRFAGADRVSVIYNGLSAPERTKSRKRTSAPRVGCIGRIAPEKGQLEFVEAARTIAQAMPDCRFVVHGAAVLADPGYEAAVKTAADGLPIEFAGWTADVPGALADLDLLLVPSDRNEATPRVILEAFAAGTPVVAFPSGGIPEMIENGLTGLLVKDASEMATAALGLLREAVRRDAVAAAAREVWQNRFTLEKWQNSVLDLLATNETASSHKLRPAS